MEDRVLLAYTPAFLSLSKDDYNNNNNINTLVSNIPSDIKTTNIINNYPSPPSSIQSKYSLNNFIIEKKKKNNHNNTFLDLLIQSVLHKYTKHNNNNNNNIQESLKDEDNETPILLKKRFLLLLAYLINKTHPSEVVTILSKSSSTSIISALASPINILDIFGNQKIDLTSITSLSSSTVFGGLQQAHNCCAIINRPLAIECDNYSPYSEITSRLISSINKGSNSTKSKLLNAADTIHTLCKVSILCGLASYYIYRRFLLKKNNLKSKNININSDYINNDFNNLKSKFKSNRYHVNNKLQNNNNKIDLISLNNTKDTNNIKDTNTITNTNTDTNTNTNTNSNNPISQEQQTKFILTGANAVFDAIATYKLVSTNSECDLKFSKAAEVATAAATAVAVSSLNVNLPNAESFVSSIPSKIIQNNASPMFWVDDSDKDELSYESIYGKEQEEYLKNCKFSSLSSLSSLDNNKNDFQYDDSFIKDDNNNDNNDIINNEEIERIENNNKNINKIQKSGSEIILMEIAKGLPFSLENAIKSYENNYQKINSNNNEDDINNNKNLSFTSNKSNESKENEFSDKIVIMANNLILWNASPDPNNPIIAFSEDTSNILTRLFSQFKGSEMKRIIILIEILSINERGKIIKLFNNKYQDLFIDFYENYGIDFLKENIIFYEKEYLNGSYYSSGTIFENNNNNNNNHNNDNDNSNSILNKEIPVSQSMKLKILSKIKPSYLIDATLITTKISSLTNNNNYDNNCNDCNNNNNEEDKNEEDEDSLSFKVNRSNESSPSILILDKCIFYEDENENENENENKEKLIDEIIINGIINEKKNILSKKDILIKSLFNNYNMVKKMSKVINKIICVDKIAATSKNQLKYNNSHEDSYKSNSFNNY